MSGNPDQPTKKTHQFILTDQSTLGPPSQGAELCAIYDSTGTPVDFTADADDTGADVVLTGYTIGSAGAVANTDTVNDAFGKIEKRVLVLEDDVNVGTLTQSGGNVAVDASAHATWDLQLTASGWTISNPTNPVDGKVMHFRLKQDSTGSRTLSWGTAYSFGAVSAPTLTTTASKTDIVRFQYNAGLSKWCYLGSTLGF
jgi:hypothetical protein